MRIVMLVLVAAFVFSGGACKKEEEVDPATKAPFVAPPDPTKRKTVKPPAAPAGAPNTAAPR